ncbi:MAG: deoxyribonuclease IV, partial [Candidatus Yanofskybacteria bacterium]|nr:deoxyribonuclease IV [Candidatus Yanofskybacteria bacterium]
GCHVSIAGGIVNAPQRAAELGCEVFQMFTRSPQGGKAPKLTTDIIKIFKEAMKKWGQENCYIHTPYYINFASSNDFVRMFAPKIVREELERGSLIGAKYIMTHLGSSKDFTREEGLKMTAAGIRQVLKGYKGTTGLLLEISAGAGNVMGDTFEELAEIIKLSGYELGICLDSAHMFASGYDIKTKEGFKKTIGIIKKTIGLDRIKLIHANDSKIELNGHKDRHDHIGDGKIGRAGFVNLAAVFNCDFIAETEHDKVKEDINILKNIRQSVRKDR